MLIKTLCAVYGSLRKTLHNHRLLEEADFLGTDTLSNFKMYSMGSFPFITPSDEGTVEVELYNVTAEEFQRLDYLEGYPSFYDRKKVQTNQGEAWIYFIKDEEPSYPPVPSGDWLTYYRGNNK